MPFIKVLHFNILFIGRLSNTWVMVSDKEDATPNSDNICNEINNGQSGVITVTCNYNNRNSPLRGRYVTVRRKDIAYERHLLNFCEVQVLSCHPGRWGYNLGSSAYDCSNACDRCRNISETCRVSDGHCYSGCKDGLWGGNCDKHCDCGDDVPCRMLDGHCFTECEDAVINNLTVRMKDHVIRLTVYVQAVTASLDVLLLVSLNEKVKCFTFKFYFSRQNDQLCLLRWDNKIQQDS